MLFQKGNKIGFKKGNKLGFQKGNKLGGKRKNSGRKCDTFRERCAALANSPKFFAWASQVFDGDHVECKPDKDGDLVYFPASTGDRVYLWEKLAAYGFGKAETVAASTPEQSVEKAEIALKTLRFMEGLVDRAFDAEQSNGGHPAGLAHGSAQVQTPPASANGV